MTGRYSLARVLTSTVFLMSTLGVVPAMAQQVSGPYVSPRVPARAVKADFNRLRQPPVGPAVVPEGGREPVGTPPPKRQAKDPAIQLRDAVGAAAIGEGPTSLGAPVVNVAGATATANPPDTVGDIGRNHYVQMVNATRFQIFDKQGTSLQGPLTFGNLWPGGDPCNSNRGDPIVVYDHLADRWNLSQFARNADRTQFWMCFAISQTPDPTAGTWFLYTIEVNAFPDYPKIGVWPDGYYMSSYEGNDLGVFVFDRNAMLTGNAAAFAKFTIGSLGTGTVRDTRILPADLDGPPPAPGTPNFFAHTVDDQQDPGGADRIDIYEFAANFGTATFSFTLVTSLQAPADIAAFDIMTCDRTGGDDEPFRDCIPQPDSAGTLDALSNRPMMQLKYRNFGTHESMVFNQTIDVSGSIDAILGFTPTEEVAGIRWYDLRRSGGGWGVNQQGTYAPQPITATTEAQLLHRWMGSAAMDAAGNIALGYSIVNDDDTNGSEVFPGLRYSGRRFDDVAGQLGQLERLMLAGTTSTGTVGARWGDYSAMSVDPVDDCTFYFTSHVVGGSTQIAAFRFDTCGTNLKILKTVSPEHPNAGEEIVYTITVLNEGSLLAENVVVSDTLPAQVDYLANTDSCTGVAVGSTGTLTCPLGDIPAGQSRSFEIKVRVDADLGGPTSITNTATVTSDTGEADSTDNTIALTHLVNELADLAVTKLCKPDVSTPAGSDGVCTIWVTNNGPSAARGVTLADTHISNGSFTFGTITTSVGACAIAVNVVNCSFGTLQPGATARVDVQVTSNDGVDVNDVAVAASLTPDPEDANNQASDGLSFTSSADLLITKSGPASVNLGSSFDYTLSVDNLGPSTASGVVVTDVLPAGVSYVSGVPSVGSVNVVGNTITWNLGSVAPADPVRTLVVTVQLLPNTPATLLNNASVSSATADPNGANNLATWSTTVVGTDLWIAKTGTVPAGNPAGALVYQITVHNQAGSAPDATPTSGSGGPNAAANVVVVDTLPLDNKKLIVQFLSPGCTYSAATHQVTCTVASLAAGTSVTFQIQVQIKGSVGNVTNVATVTSTTFDPTLGNNTDTVNNVVQGSTGKGPRPK